MSRRGGAGYRMFLFTVFGNMSFGIFFGWPAVSAVGLVGIVVTAMWHSDQAAADQRRIQEEARLRARIRELEEALEEVLEEEKAKERSLWWEEEANREDG